MIISYCKINLHKEETNDELFRTIDADIDVYIKREGNYCELLVKSLNGYDKVENTKTGMIENVNYYIDDYFIVYPNTTFEEFLQQKNSVCADVSFNQDLVEIS